MLKNIFATLVVSVLLMSSAYAASNTLKSFGNEVKDANKAVVNKKVDTAKDANKAKVAENKAKISKLKDQQKQESDKYKTAIKAKKAELNKVKKDKTISAQQKAAREAMLQRQIDELSRKDAAAKANYNKKIEQLKI